MYAWNYQGKYAEQKVRRRHRKWKGLPLLGLHLVLLILCTVRIFSSGSAEAVTYPGEAAASQCRPTESAFVSTEKWSIDRIAPEIRGVKNFTVYAGDFVSCQSGVSVTDDTDTQVPLQVDSSRVDWDRAGTYVVLYTATDSAGNTAESRATVTVLPKGEGYVDLETIYAAADAVLKELIHPQASLKEQVGAIYTWAHENLSYGGHTDREDPYQAAYSMLTTGRGDCYGYFAVTKLFFERLSIANIDVEKVKNHEQDSSHFWSLVSIDGGETYFHFDATPRAGQTEDFCLVTDSALDAYSESHKGSHNRNKSLYPATPEERP